MMEVRFIGRPEQGAEEASETFARAARIDGLQASTSLSNELGDVVMAICRIDDRSATGPDHLVVLDQELVGDIEALPKRGGSVVLNTTQSLTEVDLPADQRLVLVDAIGIALRHGFRSDTWSEVPLVMLGALARVCIEVSMEAIVESIKASATTRAEQRAAAAMDAYQLWDWL